MISVIAASIVDFNALWKIVAVSILAGAGVVGAFGYVLLGISRYQEAQGRGGRATYVLLVAVGSSFCLAAVVIGLIAMTHKS
jgi:hypothetical protein